MSATAPTPSGAPADMTKALQKLVACKDTELRLQRLHEMGHGTDYDQHRKQFAAAWESARAALAGAPAVQEGKTP